MLELNGKYATAKVFTDVVDNESISQVIELLIVDNIEPTVRIDAVIKPIYNFKAGEES